MSRMGSSTLWGKIFVFVAVCGWCLPAQAKYAGGSGTEAEPFRISAVSDWQELMATPADWASHFVLTADIDLNGVPITPIGNDAKNFTGVFDGNDYVIRNADVNMPGSGYVGLFGCLGTGGQIKNLGVENVSIVGRRYAGGLVGNNSDYGTITNCYSTGSVTGEGAVGGLVGTTGNYGTISNCCSTSSVSGTYNVGGLVGLNGYNTNISNCYSNATVTGTSWNVGGLVGFNSYGTISNCCSTGSVTGGTSVGGLAGKNGWEGTITSCYSTGSVNGTGYSVGGLVGDNDGGSISNCYSTGSVSSPNASYGGLVGSISARAVSSSFWDVNTSGRLGGPIGKGLTTGQMKSVIVYRNAGWGGKGWVIEDGLDYPHLAWEGTPGVPIPEPEAVPLLGDGTEESPYQVWSASDFAILSWHTLILDKHIELKADLDLAGMALYPIGDLGDFVGIFDGNDYIIHNAEVNMPNNQYVGLFGYLGRDGQIKNLGVENISILGGGYVAGVVGSISGTISDCYSSGSVSGSFSVGGLVGYNYSGTISDCNSTSSVSAGVGVGGLVGYNNQGTISHCYSTGSVSGTSHVGGLVGDNDGGSISYCHSTGSVSGSGDYIGGLVGEHDGTISNCYSIGSVSGTSHVGGLVGRNGNLSWPYSPSEPGRSDIYNSYSTSSVSGQDYVGGLVGTNGCVEENSEFWTVVCWDRESCEVLYLQTLGVIRKCYSEGNVFGGSAVGGLVGKQLVGAVRDCYSTGSVTGDENVGGLVGQNGYYERYCGEACYEGECWPGCWDVWIYGDIWECYSIGRVFGGSGVGGLVGESVVLGSFNTFWDIQTSQQSSSDEGRPKTTVEMTIQTTFTDAGWDFIGETANGTNDIWAIWAVTNYPYPRFVWQMNIAGPAGVNSFDFAALARYWRETNCAALNDCDGADIDLSGAVDYADVAALAEFWLRDVR